MLFLLNYARISSALTVLVLCEMQGPFINWARPRENLESREDYMFFTMDYFVNYDVVLCYVNAPHTHQITTQWIAAFWIFTYVSDLVDDPFS